MLFYSCKGCSKTGRKDRNGDFIKRTTESTKSLPLSMSDSHVETEVELPQYVESKTDEVTFSILSWNIENFGGSKGDDAMAHIVNIVKNYDIVVLQEVVAIDAGGAQAVARLNDELNRKGDSWDYVISNPTKSPSNYISERYAYLWKSSKFSKVGRDFLWEEYDVFHRSPYCLKLKLKKTNESYLLFNYHARTRSDSTRYEIEALQQLPRLNPDETVFIIGDFNINFDDKKYMPLLAAGFDPALKNKKTTFKREVRNGEYLHSSYDNIFFEKNEVKLIESKTIDFFKKNFDNLGEASSVSDHLPIVAVFD